MRYDARYMPMGWYTVAVRGEETSRSPRRLGLDKKRDEGERSAGRSMCQRHQMRGGKVRGTRCVKEKHGISQRSIDNQAPRITHATSGECTFTLGYALPPAPPRPPLIILGMAERVWRVYVDFDVGETDGRLSGVSIWERTRG